MSIGNWYGALGVEFDIIKGGQRSQPVLKLEDELLLYELKGIFDKVKWRVYWKIKFYAACERIGILYEIGIFFGMEMQRKSGQKELDFFFRRLN